LEEKCKFPKIGVFDPLAFSGLIIYKIFAFGENGNKGMNFIKLKKAGKGGQPERSM